MKENKLAELSMEFSVDIINPFFLFQLRRHIENRCGICYTSYIHSEV